jgi:hypothetical protein
MSASTAIGMVGESLRELLLGEMTLTPAVSVTILAPDETGGDRRVNLFLYKVQENATLKNLDWTVRRDDPARLVPPPLSLNLFYLMTAYAPSDAQTGNTTAHAILGEAMRVFYEHAIVPPAYLAAGLQDAREQVKIMQNFLDLEELSRVWSTFTQPFRLSVLYEVSVVQLDMLAAQERPLAPRVRQVGVPEVRAPFTPPALESLAPASGPPGTVVTCRGAHLTGWRASVSLLGRRIVDGLDLAGDTFTFAVPVELPAGRPLPRGFHELRVDVSQLARRTFFFEVTP